MEGRIIGCNRFAVVCYGSFYSFIILLAKSSADGFFAPVCVQYERPVPGRERERIVTDHTVYQCLECQLSLLCPLEFGTFL